MAVSTSNCQLHQNKLDAKRITKSLSQPVILKSKLILSTSSSLSSQMQTKICTGCGRIKPIQEFYKRSSRKSGVTSACKECLYERIKLHRLTHPKKVQASVEKWRKNNKEKILKKAKVYYDKNAPAIIAQKREYNGRMREHINARQREYNKRERATRNNELLSLRSVQLIVLFEY
jgi:hypothetical protein